MRRNGARNAVEGGGIGGSQEFLRALFGASLDGCWRDGREGKGDRDFKRRRVGVGGLPPFRGETAKGWGTRSWLVNQGGRPGQPDGFLFGGKQGQGKVFGGGGTGARCFFEGGVDAVAGIVWLLAVENLLDGEDLDACVRAHRPPPRTRS